LLLAREINEQRQRKTAAEAEVRRINETLRGLLARFTELVPNGDEPIADDQITAASVRVAAPRRIADEILDVMKGKPDAEWNVEDVATALPAKNGPTVRSTLARMADAKIVVRTGHGRYQIAGAPPRPSLLGDEEAPGHEPGRKEELSDDDL
jgi:hypothetical protein